MFNARRVAPVLFVVLIGVLLVRLPVAAANRASVYTWYEPLIDVERLVTRDFVTDPDREAMLQGAITGLLQSLNDPYTEFIPARDVAEFDKQTRGAFVGIGAEVRMEDGWLKIISPLEDSPAYKAGIMADDRITAVDGESTFGLSIFDCIAKLTGEPNTPVVVTVERDGETFDVEIIRARIVTQTVRGVHRIDDRWDFWLAPEEGIAYLRISQFTTSTAADVERVVRELLAGGMRGLILDVRFNPGGMLNSAIEIADLFLSEGVIVSTQGRAHSPQRFTARSRGTLPDFPIVVLANRQSASASEIVAGALSDNGRAIVLGERTFGKGSVQNVVPLPSGAGQLKITEQHYYLPSGRSLHRSDDDAAWGVDPTPGFYLPMTDEEARKMLTIRREEEIIRQRNGEADEEHRWTDPEWVLARLQDAQLTGAVAALRDKAAHNEWRPVSEAVAAADAISSDEMRRTEQARERLLREVARVDRRLDALRTTGAREQPPTDLLPEDLDLTGGVLNVVDAQGNTIATLRITGPGIERWLMDAPLQRDDAQQE
ncbi:MAG: S41 family peptidase [Phycisphaerales bacterium]|nr:MAG: S41 family peptidase [Phycisphaerales bacterium]